MGRRRWWTDVWTGALMSGLWLIVAVAVVPVVVMVAVLALEGLERHLLGLPPAELDDELMGRKPLRLPALRR
jgi:hypothetical protein